MFDLLKKTIFSTILFIILTISSVFAVTDDLLKKESRAKVASGSLIGVTLSSGVRVFKGVPYAQPPVGPLRWKAPQPAKPWVGDKYAKAFGPRPIQKSNLLYEFRSDEMDEDCLYLNIWTAAASSQERRPVYIFIHGGSFIHGDGSQPAYDGESMAKQGVIYVSINYRLGVFGFMAHPELSGETTYGGSGNYGLMDQLAALKWVKDNITSFGGDPHRITIGGESVGAQSVSAHMASPLSAGLFERAIAESGSLLDGRGMVLPLAKAEAMGVELAKFTGSANIADLRAVPAKKLLKMVNKGNPRRFRPTVDHYFLLQEPTKVFALQEQVKVPLLLGNNAEEVPSAALFRLKRINVENYEKALNRLYGKKAATAIQLYPAKNNDEVKKSSSEMMSDRLINYSTWKLAELQAKSQTAPVYRYVFAHPHPGLNKRTIKEGNFLQVILKKLINGLIAGTAFHAAEIEYALGNLDVQDNYAWTAEDHAVSEQLQGYFVNFIKTGNPNGVDLTGDQLVNWPPYTAGGQGQHLRISLKSTTEKDSSPARYEFFDGFLETK